MSKKSPVPSSSDATAEDIPVYGSPAGVTTQGNPDIWKVALGAKWLLLLGLGIGLGLGYLTLLRYGPTYDASARLLVTKKIPKQLKEDDRDAGSIGDRAEHIHIILSPKVILPAIEKHHLDQLKSLAGDDEAERSIIDSLRVRRVGGQEKSMINVFELTFNWGNENEANKILTAVIDAYNDYLLATRNKHGTESIGAIQKAADTLWGQLKLKEKAYSDFRQKAPLIWKTAAGVNGQSGDVTNVFQQQLLDYDAERRKNRAEITNVQSKASALEAAISRGDSPENLEILVRNLMQLQGGNIAASLVASDNGQVSNLQSTLLPYLLDEAKLMRAGFGPNYQGLVAVRENIRRVKDFFRRQGTVLPEERVVSDKNGKPKVVQQTDVVAIYRMALRFSLDQLTKRDLELTKLFDTADKEVKKFDHILTQDKAFNEDIIRLKTLHSDELNRLSKAELVMNDEGYSMEEIGPVHTEKSMKRPIQCLGMGGLLGIAVAFGLAYMRVLTDNRLKVPEDIRNQFGLSILGQIPGFSQHSLQAAARNRPDLEPSLFYISRPGSVEAEAYRSVRTSLFFRCQKSGHQILQVTSPEPQDGKTTLAANLALAMAHAGKRVLLIDADLRCPKVHKLFRMRHEIGLSDVVSGEIQLENAVQSSEIAGLSLLAAGLTPMNPAELLGGQAFESLLESCRSSYDFIVVDTPPLMAVSDPCVVASRVDALILVVRLGKNKLTTIRRSCDLLSNLGISVLGAVVNDVPDPATPAYGGAYRDGYLPGTSKSQASRPVQVSAPIMVSAPMTVSAPVMPSSPKPARVRG
ncbi:MAG: ywqD 2 [Planctomycetaceae bacterium]|nr:ywqD 2 [Planctomycetaceae bacterium]